MLDKPDETMDEVNEILEKQESLAELEEIIERHQRGFFLAGTALAKIKEGKKYKDAGYKTFEDYCDKRWGFSRVHAHRLMTAVEITQNLLPTGNIIPTAESQIRPLTAIKEPEKQREVWKEAVKKAPGGKVTAKAVTKAVEMLQKKEPDICNFTKDTVKTMATTYRRLEKLKGHMGNIKASHSGTGIMPSINIWLTASIQRKFRYCLENLSTIIPPLIREFDSIYKEDENVIDVGQAPELIKTESGVIEEEPKEIVPARVSNRRKKGR